MQHQSGLTRRTFSVRAAASVASLSGASALLAACGGEDSSTVAAAGTGTGPIDFLGFEGDDGKDSKALQAALKSDDLQLRSTYMATPDEPLQRAKSGKGEGTDVIDVPAMLLATFVASGGVLSPLDADKLTNLDNLVPGFDGTDKPWYVDGELYGMPYTVASFSLLWDSETVSDPPTAWQDLADPRFKDQVSFFNDPYGSFGIVTQALGLGEQGEVPKDQLDTAAEFIERVVDNSKSVAAAPGDIINQLTAGETGTVWGGWAAFAIFAAGAGKETIEVNLSPSDGTVSAQSVYAIGAGADNVEGAYSYINALSTPQVNADVNAFGGGVPAIEGAAAKLPPEAAKLTSGPEVERVIEEFPSLVAPPLESDEFITQPEWLERFSAITGA